MASIKDKLHVDLKHIIAQAIDAAIKDIIKPVLDRSLKNTLENYKETNNKGLLFLIR